MATNGIESQSQASSGTRTVKNENITLTLNSSSQKCVNNTEVLLDKKYKDAGIANLNSTDTLMIKPTDSNHLQVPVLEGNCEFTAGSCDIQLDSSEEDNSCRIGICGDMKCTTSSNSCEISKELLEKNSNEAFIKSVFNDAVANTQITDFFSMEMKSKTTKSREDIFVEWSDDQHQSDMIHCLNVFRKSKQFCDLVLMVGSQELYCHRVVVGGASRSILDALCRGESDLGAIARIVVDTRKPALSPLAVEILIDYMYTSKLSFAPEHLTSVYCAALQLAVDRVIRVCRQHIIAAVDTEQCIEMRMLALSYGDAEMKKFIDSFIEDNFEAVGCEKEFLALPQIKVEILTSPNPGVANLLLLSSKSGFLSSSTLNWISNLVKLRGGDYLEDLTEQIQRIPLEELSSTATSINSSYTRQTLSESESRKLVEGAYSNRVRLARSSSMRSVDSSDSSDSSTRQWCSVSGEWTVIASMQSSSTEHTISLCCVGGVLCAFSIRLSDLTNGHLNNFTNGTEHINNNHFASSGSSSSTSCSSSIGFNSQFLPMKQPRSAAGVAQIDGRLMVAGGFNQSESLDTVQCLDVSLSRWSSLPRMGEKRGRFSVAVLGGQLYAVGGSTGSCDLQSVERYDPVKDTWTCVQPLLFCCSESGVAVLDGLLYCVGGVQQTTGIAGLKYCQAYDPALDRWEYRSSTRIARRSLGVASIGGHLYAVGGSDGWKCLSSAEKYDPTTNQWSFTPSLNIPRRGSGLVEHNGSLYCVGGSDGQSFLSSVERYSCVEGDMWTLTSWTLNVPRSNAGLASLNGCVFVVGGFSGRYFLSSVELIEDAPTEWPINDSTALKSTSSESKDSSSSSSNND